MIAVCVTCEIEMEPYKNEVLVVRSEGCVARYGDTFKCPKCGQKIVIGFGTPFELQEGMTPDVTVKKPSN